MRPRHGWPVLFPQLLVGEVLKLAPDTVRVLCVCRLQELAQFVSTRREALWDHWALVAAPPGRAGGPRQGQ